MMLPRTKMGRLAVSIMGTLLVVAVLTLSSPAGLRATDTYFIDESTDFTGNGCLGFKNVGTVTASLRDELVNDSWTGYRYTNANAFPQDFQDANLVMGGGDQWGADAQVLAVYAGHGFNSGDLIAFGYANNSVCNAAHTTQIRMGTGAGNVAGYEMLITSCTLSLSGGNWGLVINNNEVGQTFGFHDSPSVPADSAADVFTCSSPFSNNADCWLFYMEDEIGLGGDNSPIVISTAQSASGVDWAHDNCSMEGNLCNYAPNEPWSHYTYTWLNHGAGPCF